MKQVELRAWVPRGLEASVGPVTTTVKNVVCELGLRGAKHELPGLGRASGATVSLRFSIDEDTDEAAWNTAHEVVVSAVNRVLHLAAFVGQNAKRFRTLQFRDFYAIQVFEVGQTEREIVGAPLVERIDTIRRDGLTPRTQELLDVLTSRPASEALWFDALESAFEERTRDAVVAARAAVEVAWKDAAQSIRDAHSKGTTPRAAAMIDALVSRALGDGLPLPQRLDKHSEAIFGQSFKSRWNAPTWQRVTELFATVRNRGAHGSGAVTETEAHRAVALARDVLDDIESMRIAITTGSPTPRSSI